MMFSYQSLPILVSVLLILSYIGYQRFFSPLARIPGPFLASLTSWWLVSQTRTQRYHRISIDMHRKYGPIVRTSPNQVSVSTAQLVRQVYPISTTAWPKSDWYRVWRGPRKLDLFAGQDQKIHKQQRKFVARAYSAETLKDLEPYVDNCLQMLMQQLDKRVGHRVDMAKWVHLFSFGKSLELPFILVYTVTKHNVDIEARCRRRNHMVCKLWLCRRRKRRWHIRKHPNTRSFRILAWPCPLRLLCTRVTQTPHWQLAWRG
jgi:hypothetical protein